MERHIHALLTDDQTPFAKEEIDLWQQENVKLPTDYLDFMIKFNGGFIYPDMFRHNVDDPDDWLDDVDDPTQLNHIYSWHEFVKKQSYAALSWPKEFVSIGEDITANSILLKITDDDFGGVYFWYRNNDSWDEDVSPAPIGKIANSLKHFILEVLFLNDKGPDVRWASFFREGTHNLLDF